MADNSKNKKAEIAETQAKGNKNKKKKKKKHPILFTIFLFFFSLFVSGMLTGIIVGGSVLKYYDSIVNNGIAVDLDTYKNSQSQTSIMYAYGNNNKLIELTRLHGEENRIWVDYDEMPEELLWAFVCLEDKRFYEHPGVDWVRTIAVLVKPEYEGQGGSTITQQLIKNLTDQNEATFIRKFNEILRALNFERNYSKKDILEAYLNTVSLGSGCYGVKTAAETYFGKEVSELTLEECATLAGITKAPYSLNPYANYEECMKRRNTCLLHMANEGKISKKEYRTLKKTNTKVLPKKAVQATNGTQEDDEIMNWYMEYVIDEVIADLQKEYDYEYNEAWRKVYYGGLNIYSAVDMEMQKQIEEIYLHRSGFPGSRMDKRGQYPQSAMTVMDYQGRIVCLVGGTGEKTTNRTYNRATDVRAKRQPGSSIKPLAVYAPAVDQGLVTASSTILEKAIYYGGKEWPRNFNGDHGKGDYITVETALVKSLNTVPVRILHEMLGTKTSMKYCNEMFHLNLIDSPTPQGDRDLSPLAVGGTTSGVTTLEMAAAFATFGNGGRYFEPYSYYKVTDRNGNVILDNTDNLPQQSIKRETATSMLSMLTKAVTSGSGTGYGSKISGFQTFAKTGTTSDNCDKWYCGGTPHYVAAVWYGYDYRANLHTGATNPAKNIFRYVFSRFHQTLPAKSFDQTITAVDKLIADAQQ